MKCLNHFPFKYLANIWQNFGTIGSSQGCHRDVQLEVHRECGGTPHSP